MEENEYRDNEKVLYKTKCTLTVAGNKPEEAECLVTEGHVVIETEEPIKIPLSRIKECKLSYPSVILTFLDDKNKVHVIDLKISIGGPSYYFNEAIYKQMLKECYQIRNWIGRSNIYFEAFFSLIYFPLLPVRILSFPEFRHGQWTPKLRFNVLRDLFSKRIRTMGRVSSKRVREPVHVNGPTGGGGVGDDITRYYITVGRLEFNVSKRIYDWLGYNDEVVVDHWPHSKTVARVERLSAAEMEKPMEKTFVMQVTGPAVAVKFVTGTIGVTIRGRVQHGTIQTGDEVQIRGRQGTIMARVFDIPKGLGVPGKEVRLALEGVTKTGDVRVGDVVEKV